MAKRKKVEIIDQELTPTVLATVADKKKGSIFSIVWVVIIFGIFIGGVYYLPDIAQYVNGYLHPEAKTPTYTTVEPEKPKQDEEEVSEKEEIKKISSKLELTKDNIKVSNIKIENNLLVVNIANTGKEAINLKDTNYFINLYNNKKALVGRVKLNEGKIDASKSILMSYDLYATDIVYLSIVEIEQKEYPAYTPTADSDGNAKLVCTRDNETINYLLNDNKVYTIDEILEIDKNINDYDALKTSYESKKESNNNVTGVASSLTETDEKLTFRTIYNLSSFVEGSLPSKILFVKDTEAKVIKFELEIKGYSCN